MKKTWFNNYDNSFIKKVMALLVSFYMFITVLPFKSVENNGVNAESNFQRNDSQKCGDNAYWNIDESTGVLTISGTGEMYNYELIGYSNNYAPWFTEKRGVDGYPEYNCLAKKIVIEEGITSIGECAFTFSSIDNVQLPNSLKKIESLAFQSCQNLKSINIPQNVNSIGSMAIGYVGNAGKILEEFSIYGYTNSVAQTYAQSNKISFVALNEKLSEPDLKQKAKDLGNIYAWDYHDYDGNGKYEAFVIIEIPNKIDIYSLYYISYDGSMVCILSEYSSAYSLFTDTTNFGNYYSIEGKGFFSFDITAGGSGYRTYLYSVKNEQPYELNISGELQGLFQSSTGIYYTTVNDFSNGFHEHIEYELVYNIETQQFSMGNRLTKTNDFFDDFEEIPEAEFTEEDIIKFDFINHHVGIAKIEGDKNIWMLSDDVDTLIKLVEFDYYYGNTGISFATEAYANLGNPIEIVIAGQKSRDLFSTVSEIMYYQALFSLLYDFDEYEMFNMTKSYYISTLTEFSEFFNTVDLSYGLETNVTPSLLKIIDDITESSNFEELANAIEKGEKSLNFLDLPIKKYNSENLSVGAGDVISLITSAIEIGNNAVKDEMDILNCVVYFRIFRDLECNHKRLIEKMYLNATDNNSTYKDALKNIIDCIYVPDLDTFILKYINSKKIEISKESWKSTASIGIGMTFMKIAEIVPGGNALQIMEISGKLIDTVFDQMNSTEQKIVSIGEILCYLKIAQSIANIGEQYRKDLVEINSFQNAVLFHDTVSLYSKAMHNCCHYGNLFLDLFISSYYSLDMKNSNKTEVIIKDNLVFKYIITSLENGLADNYLNNVFELSSGDYYSWYRKCVTLNASIKELDKYYNQPVCCIEKTEEEIILILKEAIAPILEKADNYINNFLNWTTTFIGCPVITDVFDENGVLVATIKNGNITVHNDGKFMNIFCYTLDESNTNTHGTLLMTPSNYTFTVTAQEKCEVVIQQTNSRDLSGITLSSNNWETNMIKMKKNEVFQSSNRLLLNYSNDYHKLINILIFLLITFIVVLTVIITIKRIKR